MIPGENTRCYMGLGVTAMCPLLVKSTTLLSGATMALSFLFVLLVTVTLLSSFRRLITYRLRWSAILTVCVSTVLVLDLLLQAIVFDLRQTLDVYLSLLAMNSFILLLLEQSAINSSPLIAIRMTLQPALLIAACVTLLGTFRELLGQGSLLGDAGLLPGQGLVGWSFADSGLNIMSSAPGVFLSLGLTIALLRQFKWSRTLLGE